MYRSTKPGTFFLAILLLMSFTSCQLFKGNTIKVEDKEKKLPYFISFDKGKATRSDDLETGKELEADIWFEPYDPEIGTFEKSFGGMMHAGQDTYISPVKGTAYKELKEVPEGVAWELYIKGPAIREGLVFLVRSSSGKVYKVRLKHFSDDLAKFRYDKLKE